MENDVGLGILQSNDLQAIAHSDMNKIQEKCINRISGKGQHKSGRLYASNQLSSKLSVTRRIFRCQDCDKVFTCIKDLSDHSVVCTSRQGTKQVPSCILCKKTFECSYNLTLHLQVCATRVKERSLDLSNQIPNLIKCAVCSASYISEDAFQDHMASYHGTHERMTTPTNRSVHHIECTYPKCDFKASSAVILQAHVDAYHMKKHRHSSINFRGIKPVLPYKCQYCDASFVVESILKRHIKSHSMKSRKEMGIRSNKRILKHRGEIRSGHLVGCMQEDISTLNEEQVVFHCEYCGKQVTGANELASHLKKHSEKKKYKYKLQKEQYTSALSSDLPYPGRKKLKCINEISGVHIVDKAHGEGRISTPEEREKIISLRNGSEVYLDTLTMKHNQEQITAETGSREFVDPSNIIPSDDECDDNVCNDECDDDVYDNVDSTVSEDNNAKKVVLMKCDYCSAAFVSESILKKHLKKHKNKENKLKKFGWFGWELRSSTDVSQGQSKCDCPDKVRTRSSSQEAANEMISSEDFVLHKVHEISCAEAKESVVFENFTDPEHCIDNPMKYFYPVEVKEENCSIDDHCMIDSKEMVQIDIKEELEEFEQLDILKEELE